MNAKKLKFLDSITSNEQLITKPLYTKEDLKNISYLDSLPGMEPFVRGIYSSMYTEKPWTIRQYGGFSTAEDSNLFFKRALAQGGQGLSVAFDLATHRGYDSDHQRVSGDVGKAGVAIDSVEDMKILFNDIPLNKTSISMTMSGAVLPVLATFLVAAQEQGHQLHEVSGTIQNDILKEFIVRNTYIYPPAASMNIVGNVIEFLSKNCPRFNSVSISGYHFQEAGADAELELALTLANGKEYVKTALARKLPIDAFASRLSFFWGIGMNFYSEIAKLRAARLLWSQMMRELGAKDPKSLMLRAHSQTSGWSLTEQEPQNNIARTTIEAMAAIFGGTQSLHTNSYDEALALPTDQSSRIALDTQLILQEETGICKVVDPWAGSYFMENLTKEMAQSALRIVNEIESLGGMVAAVQSGWAKAKIEAAAAATQARIDTGQKVIVGVNKYQSHQKPAVDVRVIDSHSVKTKQIERLKALKNSRNPKAVEQALRALTEAAATDSRNLLELSIEAIKYRATLGEVSAALEKVYGRYSAPTNVVTGVYQAGVAHTHEWKDLRKSVSQFRLSRGKSPSIMISKLGQDGHDRGSKIVATGLGDLGFDIKMGPLFQTPEECAQQAIAAGVDAIGVSTMTAAHKTLVPQLMSQLKVQGGDHIFVFVGGIIPTQDSEDLYKIGVKSVFGPGATIVTIAKNILQTFESKTT